MRSWRFPKQKWFCKITVQIITERWWIFSYVPSSRSCTSQLHELIVRTDENISKDSGNTSSAEVSLWDKSLVLMYSCPRDEENPKN